MDGSGGIKKNRCKTYETHPTNEATSSSGPMSSIIFKNDVSFAIDKQKYVDCWSAVIFDTQQNRRKVVYEEYSNNC